MGRTGNWIIVGKTANANLYFTFGRFSLPECIFEEVYVSFLLVGHTHEDTNVSFGQWSIMLLKNKYPILSHLMKFFMEFESICVIMHLVEVSHFKSFIKDYTC